jgi:hypothetical protein
MTIFVTIRVRWEIKAAIGLIKETVYLEESMSPVEIEVQAEYRKMMVFYHSLKWYPLILIISWASFSILGIPGLLPAIQSILQLFNVVFLQGVLNAIAYGFTPLVRVKWSGLFCTGGGKTTRKTMQNGLGASNADDNTEMPSAGTKMLSPSVAGNAV